MQKNTETTIIGYMGITIWIHRLLFRGLWVIILLAFGVQVGKAGGRIGEGHGHYYVSRYPGTHWGNVTFALGLYQDNVKCNGSYYLGFRV